MTHPFAGWDPAVQRRWLLTGVLTLMFFGIVLAAVLSTGGRIDLDATITRDAVGARDPAVTAIATLITPLGSVPAVMAVTVLVAGLLWWRTRQPFPPLLLLSAIAVTGGLVFLLKLAVSRSRPPAVTMVGVPSIDYSFPSGHTTDGTMVYLLSALLLAATLERRWQRQLLITLGSLLAFAIGVTRVYLGFHWATDVLAGWLLAVSIISAGVVSAGLVPVLPPGIRPSDRPAPDVPLHLSDSAPTTAVAGSDKWSGSDPPTPRATTARAESDEPMV
jgi:membrane-associated phospholipid phosphatase